MVDILMNLDHVSFTAGGTSYLNDVSFTVRKGENTVIFGPEGSGVDVLFRLILDFEKNLKGDISYKGRSILDFDYIERNNFKRDVGYLHGDYGLISNMSVEANIALPLEYHSDLSDGEIKKIVDRVILDLNLESSKKMRPVDLSKSEILRTAYARAVILDPDLLIVDHALEGHSPLNIRSLVDVLNRRASDSGKSVIFVPYEPDRYVDFGDWYVMLFGGRMVFRGSKEEYLGTDNEYIAQYRNISLDGPMPIL